jgi:ATP-dependent DNA ligase
MEGGRVVELLSRKGYPSAARWPDVVADLESLGLPDCILDGEIGFMAGSPYRMHLEATHARPWRGDAAIRRHADAFPHLFAAFDIMMINDEILMGKAQQERRRALLALGDRGLAIVPSAHGPEASLRLFDAVVENEGEGLMLKAPLAPYRPGERTPFVLKAKNPRWVAAVRERLAALRSVHGTPFASE